MGGVLQYYGVSEWIYGCSTYWNLAIYCLVQTSTLFSYSISSASSIIIMSSERLSMDVERGIRSEDVIERSIARIPMYQTLDTIIIDTNAKDVAVIANEIKQL